jgi:hypothetical protein
MTLNNALVDLMLFNAHRLKCYDTKVHWMKAPFQKFIEAVSNDLIQYANKLEGERN